MTVTEYLEVYHRYPWYKEDYSSEEEQEADKDKIREYNKALILKYPWLEPTNRWSGKRIGKCAAGEKGYWPGNPDDLPEWDYEYTELDNMPDGWRIAFGEKMCEEIQAALEEAQKQNPSGGYDESYITTNFDSNRIIPYVEGFMITEIKEKYGGLRFYCNGAPTKVFDVINKYEELSYNTCIKCGKPAEWESKGWISPYCNECAHKIFDEEYSKLNDKLTIDSYFTKLPERELEND